MFDSEKIKERRFVPYEIKETSFKAVGGICGFTVLNHVHPLLMHGWTELAVAAFAVNWVYMCSNYMLRTVRRIDLHKDGRTITVHPRIGSSYTA